MSDDKVPLTLYTSNTQKHSLTCRTKWQGLNKIRLNRSGCQVKQDSVPPLNNFAYKNRFCKKRKKKNNEQFNLLNSAENKIKGKLQK